MVKYNINQKQKNITDNIVENINDIDNERSESNIIEPDITKNLWNFLTKHKNTLKQRNESISIVTDVDDLDYMRAQRKKKSSKTKSKRKITQNKNCGCK